MLIWSYRRIKDVINSVTTQCLAQSGVSALCWLWKRCKHQDTLIEQQFHETWHQIPQYWLNTFWTEYNPILTISWIQGASFWSRIAGTWSHNREVAELWERGSWECLVWYSVGSGSCPGSCRHRGGTGPRKGQWRLLDFTPKLKGLISESFIAQGSSTWLAAFISQDWAEWNEEKSIPAAMVPLMWRILY